jgi:hypothetical protein
MRPDQPDTRMRILRFDRRRTSHIILQRRRTGVQHKQLIVIRDRKHILHGLLVRRRVHQFAAPHKRSGPGQPRRKSVRLNSRFA